MSNGASGGRYAPCAQTIHANGVDFRQSLGQRKFIHESQISRSGKSRIIRWVDSNALPAHRCRQLKQVPGWAYHYGEYPLGFSS
jgi:hypothetical protein